MAATDRVFVDAVSGVTDAQLLIAGTTLSGAFLAELPAVADPEFIALTLDPEEADGAAELVWVTAHTALATTATVLRAQEGTTARQHESGTKVVAGLTATAIADLYTDIETAITDLETSNDDLEAAVTTLVNNTVDNLDAATTALNDAVAATEDVTPPGAIIPYGGSAAPGGWLLCDGSAVSRATYATLFGIVGETFGVGDGSTTFNVPDMRGRFPLGVAAAGTGDTLGETGGAIDHVHTGPSHTHTGPSHTHTGPSHTHTMGTHTHTMGTHTHTGPSHTHGAGTYVIGNTDGAHTHSFSDSFTTGSASGSSHDNAPSGVLEVSQTSHTHSGSVSGTTGSSGVHGHGFAGSSAAGGTGNTGATDPGDTNATDPGDTNAGGTGATGASGTAATGASGTDNTGAANPPFIALNYIIRTGI